MAASARVAASPVTVALLGRADGAREQLRRALEDLGAQVVFEGDPAGLALDRVLGAGPRVVVVNLASGVEDDIDHLQPLFDDPQVSVVFNEADVTSQLEGWDLARWARHLAAKLMGHERTIPPPPPGAELLPLRSFMPVPGAPPTPAQLTIERPIEEFMIEAEDRVDDVPSDHLPYASGRAAPPAAEPETDFSFDLGEVEVSIARIGDAPSVEQRAVPEAEVPEIVVHEGDEAEFDVGLDLAALDAALEIEARPAPTSGKSDAALLAEALSGMNLDLIDAGETPGARDASEFAVDSYDLTGENAAPMTSGGTRLDDDLLTLDLDDDSSLEAVPAAQGQTGVSFDLEDDDTDGESITIGSISLDSSGMGEDSADGMLDDDVAALAAQLDALGDPSPRGEVRDLEFIDFSDAPAPMPSAPASATPSTAPFAAPEARDPSPAAPGASPKKTSFADLDLEPLDEAPAATAPSAPRPGSSYDFSHVNFSLEPTEEEAAEAAAAAAAAERLAASSLADTVELPAVTGPASANDADAPMSDMDALLAAMDLSPRRAAPQAQPRKITRVIVLGASIGGPDALRSFLGGIPEGFPALFILAQHLENAFFERLAQQLQKASKLPIRVPEQGRRALSGEVLVIPSTQRVQVMPDGEVLLTDHATTPRYTPCIDDVLRDVADRFGSLATAIIFSGMAGDAIEGAVYLTSQGGEVWAQDPASCVVSSMVDGARARGVVEFIGSPRELAEQCVAKYGKG